MLKRSMVLLFLLGLTACHPALPVPPVTIAPPVVTAPVWLSDLQARVATLPAIALDADITRVAFSYPGENLFSNGSVLPLAGGAEVLDPLSDLLSAFPDARWSATVQAATSNGAVYDAELAQKRAELLKRYLVNRGVSVERVTWNAAAGAGAPLALVLENSQWSAGSSSGVKE